MKEVITQKFAESFFTTLEQGIGDLGAFVALMLVVASIVVILILVSLLIELLIRTSYRLKEARK